MKISAQYASRIVALSLISYLLFLFPARVSAQSVNDFVITSFDSNYSLSNEDKQGKLRTTERIELNFSGQNRGILRAIPKVYGDTDTNPTIIDIRRDGKAEPYIIYTENNNLVLQIGEATTFITGSHSYDITYDVENVIRFYDDHDELYWDVNGDQWLQPFLSVKADMRSDVQIKTPGVICYTGIVGSKESNCVVQTESNSFSVKTTGELAANETLTFVAAFEKGYFTPMPWWEQYRSWLMASPVFFIQLFTVRSAHRKWRTFGKDPKKRGITVPYFERPKAMSVMQASYVQENKLLPKHISASIIDLAIRGYIKISEEKARFSAKHQLELLKLPDAKTTEGETILLGELFDELTVGKAVRLEDKKNKLFSALTKLTDHMDARTSDKGYYELSPKKAATKLLPQFGLVAVGIAGGFIFSSTTSGLAVITGFAVLLVVIIYSSLMTKRTHEGNMLVEHMEGLKLYLNQAEKDRIKNQDAVAAPLSPRSGEPIRDVKFFEKLLPFAVALGVEKTWAKAFENIYTQPPDWYSGNWRTFSAVALTNSIAKTTEATGTAFSSPSSSGSSGFSGGGGSAGGGGGGGGGGGW